MQLRLASAVALFVVACGGDDPPPYTVPDAPVALPDAPVGTPDAEGALPDAPVGAPDAAPPAPDAAAPIACGVGGSASMIAVDSTVTGTTAGATNTTNGSCGGASAGEAIWYFTLTTESDVVVSTDHAGTAYNTALYVRTACDDPTSQIGCAGGSPMGDGLVLGLIPPGTYFIFVDGVAGATGDYELSVTTRPVLPEGSPCDPTGTLNTCASGTICAGDPPVCATPASLCADLAVTVTPGTTYTGTTIGAANNYGPGCSNDGSAPEVVHRVDVPAGNWDLIATATPTNFAVDSFDPILTLEASCGDAGTTLDCQDSAGASTAETVSELDVAPGTYWLLVDGYIDTMGDYSLAVQLRPVLGAGATCDVSGSANRCGAGLSCIDDGSGTGPICVDPVASVCATSTAATLGTAMTGTVGAGTDDLDPSCSGGANEVLYHVDVLDGQYIVATDTSPSSFGRVIWIAGPDTCNDALELTCDAGTIREVTTGTLTAGRYYVIIDGGTAYTLNVNVYTAGGVGTTCTPGSVDDRCATGSFCFDGTCTAMTPVIDTPPNAAFCDAQGPFSADFVVDGEITGGGTTDLDNFELTLTAASTDLVLETSDGLGCSVDTQIDVYAAGASSCDVLDATTQTPIATDNNSGLDGVCSFLTVNDLAAGTYYVRVRRPSGSSSTGPYFLTVDFQ